MKYILTIICILLLLVIPGCDEDETPELPERPSLEDLPPRPDIEDLPPKQDGEELPALPEEESVEIDIDMFIAIHNEPGGSHYSDLEYQAENWPGLVDLIESADEYGHKLTLLFNPQWAEYILQDDEKLSLVRSWESNGHELGVHSHSVNAKVTWNGYTNQEEYSIRTDYIGDMDEMMDLLNQLPASGQMKTAAVTDDDSDYDYPSGVIYDVDGGWSEYEDLVSTPTTVVWGSSTLIGLKHARYSDPAGFDISMGTDDIDNAIEEYEEGQVLGVVFHNFEYNDDPAPYDFLFQYLDQKGITTRAVSDIHEN